MIRKTKHLLGRTNFRHEFPETKGGDGLRHTTIVAALRRCCRHLSVDASLGA